MCIYSSVLNFIQTQNMFIMYVLTKGVMIKTTLNLKSQPFTQYTGIREPFLAEEIGLSQ